MFCIFTPISLYPLNLSTSKVSSEKGPGGGKAQVSLDKIQAEARVAFLQLEVKFVRVPTDENYN